MQQVIYDDLTVLFAVLPPRVREAVTALDDRDGLLEIVLDLGRLPEGRFPDRELTLSEIPVTAEDLQYVVERIGTFGDDNRAGIERTLHRISAIRNRRGQVIGLTCRVGRAVRGTVAMVRDVIEQGQSLLILGRPGVGKTTLLREAARVLADELGKRVVVVDTSNEIAGDGDVPHPGIGRARRMQVARPAEQHQVMIEAVENHMPEVIVIDEIGTELEAQAARTIAERGVQLVGTAHGRTLDNLLINPTLSDLVGGIQVVTLGDEEARRRGTQKTVLERKAPPTFDVLVEQENWQQVTLHRDVAAAVDEILRGHAPTAELRTRDEHDQIHTKLITARSENTTLVQSGFGGNTFAHDMRPFAGDYGGGDLGMGDLMYPSSQHAARQLRGRGRMYSLRDPRRMNVPDEDYEPDGNDDVETLEMAEPTGTNGAGFRSPGPRRTLRIYPFGISRDRLEQSARQLHLPVEISHDQNNADAVITLKTFYRRQSSQLRSAESERKPIYILRTNTVAQMQECLARIFELPQRSDFPSLEQGSGGYGHRARQNIGGGRNPTLEVMEATENAIHHMLNHNTPSVEMEPQNAYVRRLQHQIAGRYNLESRSHGKEPNRRVLIFSR